MNLLLYHTLYLCAHNNYTLTPLPCAVTFCASDYRGRMSSPPETTSELAPAQQSPGCSFCGINLSPQHGRSIFKQWTLTIRAWQRGIFPLPVVSHSSRIIAMLIRLRSRRATDKFNLVAIGIINVHRAAGENRVFTISWLISCRDQRRVLGIERFFR